ncbi:MAG: hypothetical protein FWE03_01705 [Firmicutes bacterium]|nr:hypothetical protein [Bacillota bacterium]
MYKLIINVDKEMHNLLLETSKLKNIGIEQFVKEILEQYVVSPHIINEESMAKGYEEMGQINLELAK